MRAYRLPRLPAPRSGSAAMRAPVAPRNQFDFRSYSIHIFTIPVIREKEER